MPPLTPDQQAEAWDLLRGRRTVHMASFLPGLGYPRCPGWVLECLQEAAARLHPQNVTAARLVYLSSVLTAGGEDARRASYPLRTYRGKHWGTVQHRARLARDAAEIAARWLPAGDCRRLYLEQVAGLRPDLGLSNPLREEEVRPGIVAMLIGDAHPADWLRGDYRRRYDDAARG